jgi:tRNA dimethylallyltransferase
VCAEARELEPLLVIAGPTASGKTRLAVEAAEALDGEIVSADAFAVYRGLDIGTDKPDLETRRRVRHHLIDIADPSDRFSAGAFAEAAAEAIDDIRNRGLLPIVAGGTHFYIRALLLGLFPSPPHDTAIRAELETSWDRDAGEVFERLLSVDPDGADRIGRNDRQRILRALEVYELTGVPVSEHWQSHDQRPRYRALVACPERPRDDLYARIGARVDSMFESGLEEEVSRLLASGVARDAHSLKAIGYRQVVELLDGHCDRPDAIERTKQASRKLAKRQLTWLRSLREGTPYWVPPAEQGGTEAVIALWGSHIRGSGES